MIGLVAQIIYFDAWNSIFAIASFVLVLHKLYNDWMNLFQPRRKVLETRVWQTSRFTQAETRRDEIYQVIFGHSLPPLMLLVSSTISCISTIVPSSSSLLHYSYIHFLDKQYMTMSIWLGKILSLRVLPSSQLTSLNLFYCCCSMLAYWDHHLFMVMFRSPLSF